MNRYHQGDLAEEITTEENRRRLKQERELKKLQVLQDRESRGMKVPEASIRPGHIRDFTNALLGEVKMMYEVLGTLEDRLSPILRTSDLNTLAAEVEDTDELSPIGYQLNSVTEGLRGNRQYLSNLMDRIDL